MSLVTSTPTESERDSINQPGVSRCHRAAPGGRTNEINLLQDCPRIVAACRQTAATFCKTKECGSLPRSRYAVLSGLEHLRDEIILPICGRCVEAVMQFTAGNR